MAETMVFRLIGSDGLSRVFDRVGDNAAQMSRRISRASDDSNTSVGSLRRALSGLGTASAVLVPSAAAAGVALKGIGVAAAATTLPAVGAMVPVLAGAGAAALTTKLAFGGVSEAVTLAGEDSKEYAKALKKMSPEQASFTRTVVAAKKEFAGFGKEVQKIVLPSFTKALKQAGPLIGVVKGGVKDMAGAFADFGTEFGKLFGSNQFKIALQKNFDLGAGFFKQMAGPMADFTQAFLDFGAASKPTLDAFGIGISDLIGKGIPGFFEGLQGGIKGSAVMFDGLFDALNRVTPALGELIGAISKSAGPALGKIFTAAGKTGAGAFRALADAIRFLKPLFGEIAGVMEVFHIALQTAGQIARNTASVVLESLWPSFAKAEDARGPLQRLAGWLKNNKAAVQDFAVTASNFIIDFVSLTVSMLPNVIESFRWMATGILTAFDAVVSGAAMAFGWIPGLGPKLKAANTAFDDFKDGFITALHEAEDSSRDFAEKVVPRLERNKLKMNIEQWKSQIKTAKGQLKTVPSEKRAKLKAQIADLQAKVRQANAALASVKGKTVTIRTNYVSTLTPSTFGTPRNLFRAHGGPVFGPGTSTSDSIPTWLSNGEYVISAAAVRRYGVEMFDHLNAMRAPSRSSGATAGRSVAARATAPVTITVNGALDPVAVAQQIQRMLLELKRVYGVNFNLGVS